MPNVILHDPQQNGPIELRLNGQLPPCGPIQQGVPVDLPENYVQLARDTGSLFVNVAPAPQAPREEPADAPPFEDELVDGHPIARPIEAFPPGTFLKDTAMREDVLPTPAASILELVRDPEPPEAPCDGICAESALPHQPCDADKDPIPLDVDAAAAPALAEPQANTICPLCDRLIEAGEEARIIADEGPFHAACCDQAGG